MKSLKERAKNSIRAYIMGDALGVPFEFQRKGSFRCRGFSSGGFHRQPKGTWSDDTSILLCLIDALSEESSCRYNQFEVFQKNLDNWYHSKGFNAGSGLFDVGGQTSIAIMNKGSKRTDRMGNGALFYCLPIAIATLNEEDESLFNAWVVYTHNNVNCLKFGWEFCCILKKMLRDLQPEKIEVKNYENRGDVINTYYLAVNSFLSKRDQNSTLLEDLIDVVNYGEDTDTNAAVFGAMMGMIKKVDENDWKLIRKHEEIDGMIDKFLNSVIME